MRAVIREFIRRRIEHHLVAIAAASGHLLAGEDTVVRMAWHRAAFTAWTLAGVALELASPAPREGAA